MLYNYFCQFINNLYCIIKHFLKTKAKSVLWAHVTKRRRLVVRKYVDNLMFCGESECAFRLQNNTVYELHSMQFNTTFKHERVGKVNTNTSCVTKLQMNNKRSFNNAGIRYFHVL